VFRAVTSEDNGERLAEQSRVRTLLGFNLGLGFFREIVGWGSGGPML
jgi:hypothetical protein